MPYRMFPLLIVLAFGCSSALAQIRIGLMVSATGPTAAIGIPQKNTGALLATRVGDTTIEYVQLEDGGDTTRAVQNAKKLIGEDHIDALIGPSTTPNALAILDIIAENKVPLLATVGTSMRDCCCSARCPWRCARRNPAPKRFASHCATRSNSSRASSAARAYST